MFIIVTDAGCQLPPIKPGANTLFQPGGERNFLSKQKYGSRITEWNLVSEASGCKGCRAPRAKKMWVVLVWKLVILAWILCYVEIFLFFNNIQGVPRNMTQHQAKNIPVVLWSSPIKFRGKSVKRFMNCDRTWKQTNRSQLYIHITNVDIFLCFIYWMNSGTSK